MCGTPWTLLGVNCPQLVESGCLGVPFNTKPDNGLGWGKAGLGEAEEEPSPLRQADTVDSDVPVSLTMI